MAGVLVEGGRAWALQPACRGHLYSPSVARDEDAAEYVVPVSWRRRGPRGKAVLEKCMFGNTNSA